MNSRAINNSVYLCILSFRAYQHNLQKTVHLAVTLTKRTVLWLKFAFLPIRISEV